MRVEFHITPEIIGSCLAEKKCPSYRWAAYDSGLVPRAIRARFPNFKWDGWGAYFYLWQGTYNQKGDRIKYTDDVHILINSYRERSWNSPPEPTSFWLDIPDDVAAEPASSLGVGMQAEIFGIPPDHQSNMYGLGTWGDGLKNGYRINILEIVPKCPDSIHISKISREQPFAKHLQSNGRNNYIPLAWLRPAPTELKAKLDEVVEFKSEVVPTIDLAKPETFVDIRVAPAPPPFKTGDLVKVVGLPPDWDFVGFTWVGTKKLESHMKNGDKFSVLDFYPSWEELLTGFNPTAKTCPIKDYKGGFVSFSVGNKNRFFPSEWVVPTEPSPPSFLSIAGRQAKALAVATFRWWA